jgi:hypothetical protein
MIRFLAVLVALGLAAWTGGWFYLQGRVLEGVDQALADLAADGILVTCPARESGGYPFQITVACTDPTIDLPDGTHLTTARLEAVGLVYQPYLVLIGLQGPMRATAPGDVAIDATWSELEASIRHDGRTLERISVRAVGLDASGDVAGDPITAAASEAELHVGNPGSDAVSLATSARAATASIGGRPLLPVPAEYAVIATANGLPAAEGADPAAAWAAAGGNIAIEEAAIVVGAARVSTSGRLSLDESGAPAGTLAVTASDLASLGQTLSGTPLQASAAAAALAFSIVGRPVPDAEPGTRTVDLTIANGTVSANGIALGSVPSLR